MAPLMLLLTNKGSKEYVDYNGSCEMFLVLFVTINSFCSWIDYGRHKLSSDRCIYNFKLLEVRGTINSTYFFLAMQIQHTVDRNSFFTYRFQKLVFLLWHCEGEWNEFTSLCYQASFSRDMTDPRNMIHL